LIQIQVDESTVPVIDNERKKAVKAYLCMVLSVEKNLVFFHYDKGSRSQKTVIELLKDYQGAIQTDVEHVMVLLKFKNLLLKLK
jgi:transposase